MDLNGVVRFLFCLLINCSDIDKNPHTQDMTVRSSVDDAGINVTQTPATVATSTTTAAVPSSDPTENINVAENELDLTNDIRRRRGFAIQQEELRSLADETAQAQENGAHCRFNSDCSSGCCLAATREDRVCSSLVSSGNRCEIAQIKGGYYADFCPCLAGDDACVATNAKGRRQLSCLQ